MIKFKSLNPLDEILDLIRMNNPLLAEVPAAAITPKTITPITGNKNTRITLFGDGNFGLIGQVELEYDRVDIGKIFNQFVAVTKKPRVRVFGKPGSTARVLPGSTLKIRFSNSGFKINEALVTRKAFAYLNSDATLKSIRTMVWTTTSCNLVLN